MDVRLETRTPKCPAGDPSARRADGDGESHVGLHADPRRAEKRRPPSGALDHSADLEGSGPAAGAAAPDVVADVSESLGSTPHPEALFMQQIVRTLTMAGASTVSVPQVLICDRDRKWSRDMRRRLRDAGVRVVLIPERAPNANAYAERFVRSIKEECLDRLIPIGERHFRRAVAEYVEHYHRERNHQGLGNALIVGATASGTARICRRPRLGGLLNFYERAA